MVSHCSLLRRRRLEIPYWRTSSTSGAASSTGMVRTQNFLPGQSALPACHLMAPRPVCSLRLLTAVLSVPTKHGVTAGPRYQYSTGRELNQPHVFYTPTPGDVPAQPLNP